MITDKTTSLIIRTMESDRLLGLLKNTGPSRYIYQGLSHYSVSVRAYELQKLQESGCVEMIEDNMFLLTDQRSYSEDYGLTINNHWLEDIFIL